MAKWDAESTLVFEDVIRLRIASQILKEVNDARVGPIIGYNKINDLDRRVNAFENDICTWLTEKGLGHDHC